MSWWVLQLIETQYTQLVIVVKSLTRAARQVLGYTRILVFSIDALFGVSTTC